ncbi:hypothetical protein GPU89_02530 [Burkholderia cepacia]|nr:hypothetical protein [Burkholderia cepacia]
MWRSIQPSMIDTQAAHFMPSPDEGISLNILVFEKFRSIAAEQSGRAPRA